MSTNLPVPSRTPHQPPEETLEQLREMADHLDALFLVVVVGEFNAGKSTVMNALFGEVVMEEGPIPTTAKITILRYGERPLTQQRSEFLTERRVPADLLRHLTLVDTPGTNSIVQEHQRITEDFVPRSDLVLFVTSFDRPLTESERTFLSYIREDWGRRLVVVLNKADLAESESDLTQVVDYIQTNVEELMGVTPTVLPVSARLAFRAKTAEGGRDAALWEKSRFEALEQFLTETLAGAEQVALKLDGPLASAERLLERASIHIDDRRAVLESDRETLDHLQDQIDDARGDLEAGYAPHLDRIEEVFADVRRRGVQFLDDTIRVSRINLLRDRERFRQQFIDQVVSETTRQIEQVVTDAVDAILSRTMQLQQDLFRTFAERVKEARSNGRFAADRGFAYDRREVFESIMNEAERQIRSHDLRHEVPRDTTMQPGLADALEEHPGGGRWRRRGNGGRTWRAADGDLRAGCRGRIGPGHGRGGHALRRHRAPAPAPQGHRRVHRPDRHAARRGARCPPLPPRRRDPRRTRSRLGHRRALRRFRGERGGGCCRRQRHPRRSHRTCRAPPRSRAPRRGHAGHSVVK